MNKNEKELIQEEENLFDEVNLSKDKLIKKNKNIQTPPKGVIDPNYISTNKDQRRKTAASKLTKRNIQLATKVNEITYEKLKTAARIEGRHLVFILERAIDDYWAKNHPHTELDNLD